MPQRVHYQRIHRLEEFIAATVNDAIFRIIENHRHRHWVGAQEGLFKRLRDPSLWNSVTQQGMISHIIGSICACDSDELTHFYPITEVDKNNVVQAIACLTGVYKDARQFRLPGSAGTQSIFSDPTAWRENLHVVVEMTYQKLWAAPVLPPAPPPPSPGSGN